MQPSPTIDLSEVHAAERVLIQQADAIRELSAHIHAGEARLAAMLAEFTADGSWNASGDWRSVTHWLGMNCGYAPSEAQALARVADRAHQMPSVMARAEAGEVSLGVAAMAARVASPEIDEQLASIVANTTPTQAARVIAQFRSAKRRKEAEAAEAGEAGEPDDAEVEPEGEAPGHGESSDAADASFWRSWFDDDGLWQVTGRAPAEVGALLDEAFEAAMRSTQRDSADGGHRDHQAGNDGDVANPGRAGRPGIADALRAFADLALDAAKASRLTREGGEHFGVTVLIDIETLVSGNLRPGSICQLESGPHVTPGLVRRLVEEGFLQTLWHRAGIPLMLGNEARFASRAQRRALRFRDGGCGVPGCGATRHLHAHHLIPYPIGPTDLDNLILLCSFHHRRLHQGRLFIEPDGNQRFTFRNDLGEVIGNRLIRHTRTPGRAPTGKLECLPGQRTLSITPDTPRPGSGYAPLTEYAQDIYLHALLTAA